MMQAIRNIIAAFNSDDEEDEDEEDGGAAQRRSEELRHVAVNAYGDSEEDDDAYSSGTSSSDDSSDEDEDEDEGTRAGVPTILKGGYFSLLGNDYWATQRETVLLVHKKFMEYSPLIRCLHTRAYTELDLIGLEYLISDVGRKQYETLPFPAIYLNTRETGQVRTLGGPCGDTFIVNRTLDYVYGRLIEMALMHGANQRRLPHGMDAIRNAYWARRNRLFPLCRKPQCLAAQQEGDRLCHQQCVIYTRSDSEFFMRCERVRDANLYVDYEKHSGVAAQQSISFHLVNLLCGPFIEDNVEKYDKWVVLPIDFLDLWNASPRQ